MNNTPQSDLTTITLCDLDVAPHTSRAVTWGKALLSAGDGALVDNDGCDECALSEMEQYLLRRGFRLRYDHDAGMPRLCRA